jgi:hypothetical protein
VAFCSGGKHEKAHVNSDEGLMCAGGLFLFGGVLMFFDRSM